MASSKLSNASERSRAFQRVSEILQTQRQRVDGFLAESSRNLDSLEARFAGEIESIQQRCQEWVEFQEQLQAHYQGLEKEQRDIDRRESELSSRASEVERVQQETKDQRQRAARKLEDRRRTWLAEQSGATTDLHNKLFELERQLAVAQEALSDAKSEANGATDLRTQVRKLEQQLATAQEALSDAKSEANGATDLRTQVRKLEQQLATAQEALSDARSEAKGATDLRTQVRRLEQQLATAQETLAEKSDEVGESAELQNQLTQLEQQLAVSQQELADARAEADVNREAVVGQQRTIDERDELIARLTAESRDSNESQHHDRQAMVDLQLKYEMAMESVESLREKNDSLEEEIVRLQAAAEATPRTASAKGRTGEENWEATKRRLLANLDNDDVSGEDQERIEEAIQRTESQLTEKNREIEELRRQLSDALDQPASESSQAENLEHESILSADHLIAAERDKLAKLQAELMEKLRSAEIECAKERAQNTRMRSELQEKLRDLETELSRARGNNGGSASKAKSSGRRWLDHLGLQPDGK